MLRTSASSGDMTRRRSWSVLLGAMCSSGMSCAGGRVPVLDQAVVRQLGQFLDPDARLAENLHGGPGPERFVFFQSQVPALPGSRVLGPGPRAAGAWAAVTGAASPRRR